VHTPISLLYRTLSRRPELEAKLRELAEALAADMAEEGGLRGKTVTLKLKLTTFEVGMAAGGVSFEVETGGWLSGWVPGCLGVAG